MRGQQFGEGLLPTGTQRGHVDGLAQQIHVAIGQVQQRIDVGDAQFVPAASGPDDGVSGLYAAFGDHAEVEARTVMGDKEIRHVGLAEAHADTEAGHSRLGDLELRIADGVAVADTDLVVPQPGDREVLAEMARLQVVAPEKAGSSSRRTRFGRPSRRAVRRRARRGRPARHRRCSVSAPSPVPAPGSCRCRCRRSCPATPRRRASRR